MIELLLLTISMTLPCNYADATPLPAASKLVAIVYEADTIEPDAAVVGYPCETVSVEVTEPYGSWYATAWEIFTRLESEPSETVTKEKSRWRCSTCHDSVVVACEGYDCVTEVKPFPDQVSCEQDTSANIPNLVLDEPGPRWRWRKSQFVVAGKRCWDTYTAEDVVALAAATLEFGVNNHTLSKPPFPAPPTEVTVR